MTRAFDDFAECWRDVSRLSSGFEAGRHLRDQYIRGLEARIYPEDCEKASDEKRGADEQHEGKRDFDDDQCAAQTLPVPRRSTGAILERGRQIDGGCLKRGDDAEDDCGQDGRCAGHHEHARIEGDSGDARKIVGHGRSQHADGPPCEADRRNGSRCRQRETLNQHLTNQTPSPGA